jgi:hypothetical protein
VRQVSTLDLTVEQLSVDYDNIASLRNHQLEQTFMAGNQTQSEQTVIFVHIPATAGTTLDYIIKQNLPRGSVYTISEDGTFDDFKNLDHSRKSQIRLLHGHVGYGVHKYLPEPCAYITLLRDPIDRVISYYYFVRRTPEHYLYDQGYAKNMSLLDFVNLESDVLVDNCQTRLLSGLETGWEVGFGQCTGEILETAKRNLREHVAVVGLTEEFDTTLVLLKRAFGWRRLAYFGHNISTDRPARGEIPQVALDAIARVNSLDVELYEYARALFEERIRRQGVSLVLDVKSFQITHYLYWAVRKVSVRTIARKLIHSVTDRSH